MGGGRWKRTAASGSGLVRDWYAGVSRTARLCARMRRASRGACCSASLHQTISMAVTTRMDATAACVESNASSAANTYFAAARAIPLASHKSNRHAEFTVDSPGDEAVGASSKIEGAPIRETVLRFELSTGALDSRPESLRVPPIFELRECGATKRVVRSPLLFGAPKRCRLNTSADGASKRRNGQTQPRRPPTLQERIQ